MKQAVADHVATVARVATPRGEVSWFSPKRRGQSVEVLLGDARELVRSLEVQFHCCVTSPPYWRVKHYGEDGRELGWEPSVARYVEELCDLFDAIPLHERASLWINMGDRRGPNGELVGLPARLQISMQEHGWSLIDHVVWAKGLVRADGTTLGSYMPEPAPGRLNGNGWEAFMRFARSRDAWTDTCAVNIPRANGSGPRYLPRDLMEFETAVDGRRPPNVWLVDQYRTVGDHPADYPRFVCEIPVALSCPPLVNPDGSLPERITKQSVYDDLRGPRLMGKYGSAGPEDVARGSARQDTSKLYVPRRPVTLGWTEVHPDATPGVVIDPFAGSCTTGEVALKLGRSFVGIELYEKYRTEGLARLGSVWRSLQDEPHASI